MYPDLARDAKELTRQTVQYGMIEQYNRGVRAAMDAIGPHALARLPDGARKRLLPQAPPASSTETAPSYADLARRVAEMEQESKGWYDQLCAAQVSEINMAKKLDCAEAVVEASRSVNDINVDHAKIGEPFDPHWLNGAEHALYNALVAYDALTSPSQPASLTAQTYADLARRGSEMEKALRDIATHPLHDQVHIGDRAAIGLAACRSIANSAIATQAPPASPTPEMKRYNFDRYHDGVLKAEGVSVHATTLFDAEIRARGLLQDRRDVLRFTDNEPCCAAEKCEICSPASSTEGNAE